MHDQSDHPTRPAPADAGTRPHASLPAAAQVPALASERRPTARRRRAVGAGALALLAAGAGLWAVSRRPLPPQPAGPPPSWHLDVRTDGGGTRWVLVFGREAGLYLMRTSELGRVAGLPGQLPGRKVSMMSLGWAPLTVRGDAGGAGGVQSFRARSRVVTVFQDGARTGVRTGF